jgi:hypothetical protein
MNRREFLSASLHTILLSLFCVRKRTPPAGSITFNGPAGHAVISVPMAAGAIDREDYLSAINVPQYSRRLRDAVFSASGESMQFLLEKQL